MKKPSLTDIQGIGKAAAVRLTEAGYITIDRVAETTPEKLSTVSGFAKERALRTIAAAKALCGDDAPTGDMAQREIMPPEIKPSENKPVAKTAQETPPQADPSPAKTAEPQTRTPEPIKPEPAKPVLAPVVAALPVTKPSPKPSPKPTPKAAPKAAQDVPPRATPSHPANTPASRFKEPGYIAAGVLVILAVYGFAQQPGVQQYMGFSSTTDNLDTAPSVATLTTPADQAVPTPPQASPAAPTPAQTTARPASAPQTILPPAPLGPYASYQRGFNYALNGYGGAQGNGQTVGQTRFSLNFNSRARTQNFANGSQNLNGNGGYARVPHGYAPYGYAQGQAPAR